MPQFDVTGPDGKTYSVNAPDGASQDDAIAYVKQSYYDKAGGAKPQAADAGLLDKAAGVLNAVNPVNRVVQALRDPTETVNNIRDATAGAVRGAGSIGATAMMPVDAWARMLGVQNDFVGRDDRRTQMDAALKGLGADTDSTAFGFGKLAAEVAGTAAIPGAAARGLRAVLPSAPVVDAITDAIATGGTRIGPYAQQQAGGALQWTGQALRNAAIRTGGGATAGALTAAAVDPSDAAGGAAIGAAIPNVVKVAGALGSGIRNTAAAVSNSAAERNAINKIADAVGEPNIQQAIADVQTYYPKGAEAIPVSSAGITLNPNLAQMEQGSRLRAAPAWMDFDQRQSKAVADNVLTATKDAEDIGQLKADRAQGWKDGWDWAQQNLKPRVWTGRITQFYDDLGHATQAAESSNPDVLNALKTIQGEMERLGPAFGPGNLQQLRANLAEGYNPASSNPFKNVPRDSPAMTTIKKEMDDILNSSTGGRWQKVLDNYSSASRSIEAADAARTVRGSYYDEATGRVLGKSRDPLGDVPSITEFNLGSTMNKARLPDKSLALTPEANQRLEATLAAIRRQNMVQGLKRTATAGGGSDTVSNAIAEGVAHSVKPSLVLQMMDAMRQIATGKTDAQVARLLSSPDEMAKGLGALGMASRGPSGAGQAVYRALPLLATQGD